MYLLVAAFYTCQGVCWQKENELTYFFMITDKKAMTVQMDMAYILRNQFDKSYR